MVGKGTVAAIGAKGDGKDVFATVIFESEQRRIVELEGSGRAFVRGDGEGEGVEVARAPNLELGLGLRTSNPGGDLLYPRFYKQRSNITTT